MKLDRTVTKESRPATWQAANGHLLEGEEIRFLEAGQEPTRWRTEGWNARHSDDCQCETGGADMEDW